LAPNEQKENVMKTLRWKRLVVAAGTLLLATSAATHAGIVDVDVKKFDITFANGWDGIDPQSKSGAQGKRSENGFPGMPTKVLDVWNGEQSPDALHPFKRLYNNQQPNAFAAARAGMSYTFDDGTFNHLAFLRALHLTQNALLDQNGQPSQAASSVKYEVDLDFLFDQPLANPITLPVGGWLFNLKVRLPGENDSASLNMTGTWSTDTGADTSINLEWAKTGAELNGNTQAIPVLAELDSFVIPAGSTKFNMALVLEAQVHNLGGGAGLGSGEAASMHLMPSPGALALLGLAGICGVRRRRT
jgi:hypothetical protein